MWKRNIGLRIALCCAVLLSTVNLAWAEDRQDEVDRVNASAKVLNEIMAAPDKGIPQEIMEQRCLRWCCPVPGEGRFHIWR